MKKHILSLLLAIFLMATFLPAAVLAADGDVDYLYCDENGANWATGTKSVGEYKTVTENDDVWTDGWYVVDRDISIGSEEAPQRVTVIGNVHLILKDGCELIIMGGIQLEDNDTSITNGSPNTLTVYAQSDDESTMGKLTAIVNGQDAAIGATFISYESKTNCGTMTINGGIIEAKSIHGAGIGGAYSGGDGGIITVNGGIVKAESKSGTGIGGGQCGIGENGGYGGIFTINGGAVYAKGHTGIGGGEGPCGGDGGIITINGGYVKAEGGSGAGIGGARGIGEGGNSGTITISGGIVEAKSEMGAGIGGGYTSTVVGTCEKITITGGIVKAESVYGAGIGSARCDTGMFGNAGDITISGGTVTAISEYSSAIGSGWSYVDLEYNGNIIIKGGHVIARSLCKLPPSDLTTSRPAVEDALTIAPDLDSYEDYYWRTDTESSFTAKADAAYSYSSNDTYVEFSNGYTYTVTLDPNYEGGTPGTLITSSDGKPDLPVITRELYELVGWFTDAQGGNEVTEDTKFTKNSTIFAHWTYASYDVILNTNGADSCKELTEYTYSVGAKLPIPVKAGFAFEGWYANDSFTGDAVKRISTTDSGEKVFYAKWKKLYWVTFDLNGGEADPLNPIYHGNPIPTIINTKGDMQFVGWFTKNGENGDWGEEYTYDTVVDENITVYAKWNDTTVIFDENGGDTPAKRYYNDKKDIYHYPSVNPTRTGYYFDGWWTKDGTGGDWGEKYTTVDFDNRTEKKTVYAKWSQKIVPKADMFDFTFHNEDTPAVSNRVTVTPKTEYKNIFNVTNVKYKNTDYDDESKQWVVQFSDELLLGNNTIIADIESLSDDYASAEGLEIGNVSYYGGYLYIDEQSTADVLMKFERWNYEGGILNVSQPGFTTDIMYSLTNEDKEYTDKIIINKRSDGVYVITWGEADLPANEYIIHYVDSKWTVQTKTLYVYKCPVYPTVEDTVQKYNPSGNEITIASNGTKLLDNSKLKVDYYPVDEESGTLSSLTPVSQVTKPGKYMYVISVDDSAADNYIILFRYVPKGTDIPDFRAFDNVGFFTVTPKEADITPQTNAVHTYDGKAYDVSGLFTVDPLAGDKVYSMVKDSETTGEGTLNGNMLTVTKAGTFKIKLNTAETDKCLSGEATAFLTVKKATPGTIVYPTAGDVTYGDTLAQSTLTGGSTNGSFKWKNESTHPTVNNSGYEVVFTPADGDFYDYSGVNLTYTVSVKVNPRKVIIEWLGTDGLVYDEGTKTVSARVANACFGDNPNLTLDGDYSAIQVGIYTATVTGVDNPNYTLDGVEASKTSKTWYISKGTNSFTSELKITGWTYGDTANSPSVSAKFGTPHYLYSDRADGAFTSEVPQNAGTYYVKAAVDGTVDYAELISDDAVEFKIEPKSIADAVLSAKNSLKYNGLPQKQEIELSLNGFTNVTYDISDDTETNVNQNGSYNLKVIGTGNFTGSKELEWNIEKADLTENTSKLTTAKVHKNRPLAEARVTDGEMLGIGNAVIAGSFAWEDPSTVIKEDSTAKMIFTPADGNYNEKIIDVSVSAYSSIIGSVTMSYTVKFDTNGGNKIASQNVTSNSKAAEPTKPTKDGYIFDGWYTDGVFTSEYDFDTKVTKNITLYAKWTEIEKEPDKPTQPVEPTAPEWKNPFTDVKENDWFFESVKFANQNGLMSGMTNTTFAPNGPLTRGMLVCVIYRAEGEPAVNKSIPFSDVKSDMYYANAVNWARQNGIVNGVTETKFAPDENITREQIAAIMFRYAKYKGYDVSVGENTNILSYTDFDKISEYAIEAMQYAFGSGLMKGKTEVTLNPKDFATRAEIAAILQRFLEANK